jgi:hypothetical protein
MRFPLSRGAVTVVLLAAVVGVGGYLYASRDGGSSPAASVPSRPEPRPEEPQPAADAERARLASELQHGVDAAAALGGTAEAAIMLDRWSAPVIISSEAHGEERFMRMWSMSKVATMVAVLRGLGWARQPGRPLSPELEEALRGAITRSENCRQRRVVLELQNLAGGTAGAREALAEVFHLAGGEARIGTQIEAPEPSCVAYLETQSELDEPLAPALLLGTSTWRVGDAVRLVHALSVDAYGPAVSQQVLRLMRLPKQPSREVQPGELTASLAWGAGESLPPGTAYKAGWGGSLNGNFLAGQIALADFPGLGRAALVAVFHPDAQPPRDDPGITSAPEALDAIFSAISGSPPPLPLSAAD